ncbi:hypothetical protein K438DRAFT_1985235 [Mycena galopus ATCC 62051]|nr:hypothetical protein K438DRAFT_1985235 [Mycena galopus ATCC 62051]
MSPPPNAGPRPLWFSVGAGANVEVLEHGNSANTRLSEPTAAKTLPAADAVTSASPSVEPESSARSDDELHASPRVHFLEPVVDTVTIIESPQDGESSADPRAEDVYEVHDPDVDIVMSPGDEEYRKSPASPNPAPESEADITPDLAPPVLAEGAVSAPVEDVLPSPRQTLSPVVVQSFSPAWRAAVSLSPEAPPRDAVSPEAPSPAPLARDPSPPPAAAAPPPLQLAKVSFKDWQERKKMEREAEERERERQRDLENEREKEREHERAREDDPLGDNKENAAVPKNDDGLNRILDVIWCSAPDKTAPPDVPVQQDVEMPHTVSVVIAEPPSSPLDDVQPKDKTMPLSITLSLLHQSLPASSQLQHESLPSTTTSSWFSSLAARPKSLTRTILLPYARALARGRDPPQLEAPYSVGWRGRFGPKATPRTSPFSTPTVPPTQPRSHQLQRMLPSAPKALREAQNPNPIGLGSSGASGSGGPTRGGAPPFNDMDLQTMPPNASEPTPRSGRRGGWRKYRPRAG